MSIEDIILNNYKKNNKTTYTVKLRTECNLETCSNDMTETIKKAVEFLHDIECDFREEWYEIEVIDNITEFTVFKERKLKCQK